MSLAIEPRLLTAEEYAALPNDGRLTDLVRGRIVEMNRPFTAHGYTVSKIIALLWQHVAQHDLGRVVGGDAGVVTERNPDTVRGPDVAFYSFTRIPRGPLPSGYWPVSPELVIEVRSPSDRWKEILHKVAEYLQADVVTMVIVDPDARSAHVFSADQPTRVLSATDSLTLPGVLPHWTLPLEQLFS